MKTSTKWILGIVIGLIFVCAVVAVVLVGYRIWSGGDWAYGVRFGRLWDGDLPFERLPVMPHSRNSGQWFGFFSPLSWIGGPLILCLGFLALVGLGVVGLVLALRRSTQSKTTRDQTDSIGQDLTPEPTGIQERSCSNCGRPVQEKWRLCPHCGNSLVGEGE